MADESKTQAAVYVAFATLNHALDDLAQGMPNVVDRSAFPGLSGGVQNQLLAGMRFLGLIDDAGRPQPALDKVAVSDTDARKAALREILEAKYKEIFALDLLKLTPAQLKDCMAESYNVSGDTRDKAVRFFLSAVQFVGLPVSRYLGQAKSASPASPRKRRAPTRTRNGSEEVEEEEGEEEENGTPTSKGTGKTIKLKSGHTLTVSTTAGMFDTTEDDRKFLFEIIDKLNAYERANESTG
jgi:hypothetical protein